MAINFRLITNCNLRSLKAGEIVREHGVCVERTAAGDLRYSINVMVDGHRIHRVVGLASEGVTRTMAQQVIEQRRTEARERRLRLPKGRKVALRFEKAALDYLERLKAEGGRTIARKTQHISGRLSPSLGTKALDEIEESDVRRYVVAREKDGAMPGTINRELATLSHLMRKAASWGWIEKGAIPTIPRLAEGPGRVVALTIQECKKLLDAAKADSDPDLWLFVLLCLHTSMRHGEARNIRWEDIDFNRQRIRLPKAKSGARDQPITAEAANALLAERTRRAVYSGPVFAPGAGSKSEVRHTFRKAFQRAVEKAGLDASQVTPHVLRHTAITRLVKARVDLPTIQRVSGHKTLLMVLRYTHVDGRHIDDAIEHLSTG